MVVHLQLPGREGRIGIRLPRDSSPRPRPRTPVIAVVRLASGRYAGEIAGGDEDLLQRVRIRYKLLQSRRETYGVPWGNLLNDMRVLWRVGYTPKPPGPWRRVDEYSNRLINTGANGDIFSVAQNKFQVAAYEAEDPF